MRWDNRVTYRVKRASCRKDFTACGGARTAAVHPEARSWFFGQASRRGGRGWIGNGKPMEG